MLIGDPVTAPAAVAALYGADLSALIDEVAAEVRLEVLSWTQTRTAQEAYAQDASAASQARILTDKIFKKFMERFARGAKKTAGKFGKRSDRANEAAVKSSIKKLASSISLPPTLMSPESQEVLTASVAENVSLIKSIGAQYLGKVQQSVMRSLAQGTDITQLQKDLERIKGVSKRRAKVIAYDQTHKISSALSRERFQRAGLTHYVWRHTAGSNEPRPLHVKMDGEVFRYDTPVKVQDDPVVYGFPGTLINCSCRQQPVVEFSDEED